MLRCNHHLIALSHLIKKILAIVFGHLASISYFLSLPSLFLCPAFLIPRGRDLYIMLSMALCQHSFVGSQQQIKQDTLISALIGINNHSTVGKPEKKKKIFIPTGTVGCYW